MGYCDVLHDKSLPAPSTVSLHIFFSMPGVVAYVCTESATRWKEWAFLKVAVAAGCPAAAVVCIAEQSLSVLHLYVFVKTTCNGMAELHLAGPAKVPYVMLQLLSLYPLVATDCDWTSKSNSFWDSVQKGACTCVCGLLGHSCNWQAFESFRHSQ